MNSINYFIDYKYIYIYICVYIYMHSFARRLGIFIMKMLTTVLAVVIVTTCCFKSCSL